MKLPLYNIKAESIGDIELPDAVFNKPWNPDLVHQAFIMYAGNLRTPVAHTKTRGEVRGGGKKPWRQKGTGRARHGSTRSPIWVGGGVTHGPRNDKSYERGMNKKMKRVALACALSEYIRKGKLKVVDGLKVDEPKTRDAQKILINFFGSKKIPSVLMVPSKNEKNMVRASRNLPKIEVASSDAINTYNLLQHSTVLIDKEAIAEIAKFY